MPTGTFGKVFCLALRAAIVLGLGLVVWNWRLDPNSGDMRLGFTSVIFVISLLLPRSWLLAPLVLLPCLEIPTLRLGYPNQFLSDCLLLAWMAAVSLRDRQSDENSEPLVLHPYFGTTLVLAVLASAYLLISLYELRQMSFGGLPTSKLLESLVRRLFLWDVHDPLHNVSVIFGYWIQVMFMAVLWSNRSFLRLSTPKILGVILAATSINAVYAIGQWLRPDLVPVIYTVDIGGLTQNGNLLSFMGGLGVIGGLWLSFQQISWRLLWLIVLGVALAVFATVLGKGRLAWLSLLLVAGLFLIVILVSWFRSKFHRGIHLRSLYLSLLILVVISGAIIVAGHKLNLSNDPGIIELLSIFKTGGWRELVFAGGREAQFLKALEMIRWSPWFGIGMNSFLSRSELELAVHNLFLQWWVGLGLFACLAGVLLPVANLRAWGGAVWKQWQSRISTASLIAGLMLFYIFLAQMGDHPTSYRSMFALSTLIATAFQLEVTEAVAIRRSVWSRRLLALTILIASIVGFASILSPQSLPHLAKSYPEESDTQAPGGRFAWHAIVRTWELPPSTCISGKIKSVYPTGRWFMKVVLTDSINVPPRYASLSDFKTFERQFPNPADFELEGGRWQDFCSCNLSSTMRLLYLRSTHGEILSTSKVDFGIDPRFVGFATAQEVKVSSPNGCQDRAYP